MAFEHLTCSGNSRYSRREKSGTVPSGFSSRAPHKDLAHEFINYAHRPEVGAAFIDDSGFNSSNRLAANSVERWILAQPAIFPSSTSLVRCEFMRDIGPLIALYDRYWTEIKARQPLQPRARGLP